MPPAALNLMTRKEMERYTTNKVFAAQILGIDASTLWPKAMRYDL